MSYIAWVFAIQLINPIKLTCGLTFSGIHASHSIKGTHCGFPGLGPRALHHGASLWQQVILHGFHEKLLTLKVICKHWAVF